ncbi:MAG: NAD(P)-dependent oxidoreductase [Paracoccaceae bacterium]
MTNTQFSSSGMRVLVTGAGGFLGRHVTAGLLAKGAQVTALLRHIVPLQSGVAGIEVLDLETGDIGALLRRVGPDVILHCAGLIAAPDDEDGRARLMRANYTVTDRLLHAARSLPQPPRVVLVSSAAIWAPMVPGQGAITEEHPMRPVAAYGVSKAAATLLGLAMNARGDLPVAVGVPFNVIGPGQPARLVPQVFIDQLRANPDQIILNDPGVIRDWIDVRDVASALILLAHPDVPPDLYNIATGRGLSLGAMAQAVCAQGGWHPSMPTPSHPAASGVARSIGSSARLQRVCGWRADIPLDETLVDMLQ